MIGRWHGLVLDCPAPRELAGFYQQLLGMDRVIWDTESWVSIEGSTGGLNVSFQQVSDFRAPQWPDPSWPQQMHMDVMVSDLDAAEPLVLALGGKLLDGSDKPIGYRVYADPIGHPFCLVTPESIMSDPSEVHPA
jgi:Glyoxalase-like domain